MSKGLKGLLFAAGFAGLIFGSLAGQRSCARSQFKEVCQRNSEKELQRFGYQICPAWDGRKRQVYCNFKQIPIPSNAKEADRCIVLQRGRHQFSAGR